jgi:hypothetical protein
MNQTPLAFFLDTLDGEIFHAEAEALPIKVAARDLPQLKARIRAAIRLHVGWDRPYTLLVGRQHLWAGEASGSAPAGGG